MFKNVLKILMVFSFIMPFTMVSAASIPLSPTLVGNVIKTIDEHHFEVEVSADPSNKPTGVVDIPGRVTIDGNVYTVTEVAESAFTGLDITMVKLPSTVSKINKLAFFNCKKLTNVVEVSHGSVKTLSMDSFRNTKALVSAYFPSVVIIPDDAFYGSGLVSADFPAAEYVGLRAFYECKSLKSVTLSPDVNTISANAFLSCHVLTHIALGHKLQTIGVGAFMFCYTLDEIVIPASLTTLGEAAFSGCSGIKNIYLLDADYTPSQDMSGLLGLSKIEKIYYVASLKESLEAYYRDNETRSQPQLLPVSSIVRPDLMLIDVAGYKFKLEVLNADVTNLKVSSSDDIYSILQPDNNGVYTSPSSSILLQYTLNPWCEMWYYENLRELSGINEAAVDSIDCLFDVDGRSLKIMSGGDMSIDIYDTEGRDVFSSHVASDGGAVIDLSGLASGMYIVKFGKTVKKIFLK